jgi:hypothetical protein
MRTEIGQQRVQILTRGVKDLTADAKAQSVDHENVIGGDGGFRGANKGQALLGLG